MKHISNSKKHSRDYQEWHNTLKRYYLNIKTTPNSHHPRYSRKVWMGMLKNFFWRILEKNFDVWVSNVKFEQKQLDFINN